MVNFWVYDVIFMVLFTSFVAWFLYKNKKATSREGIMFMYRTKFGIKAINYIGDNWKKLLHALKTPIISIGFLLMGTMLWMLGQTISLYVLNPAITQIIKAPPIAPLIPYFPKIFGMESFFPPFYFTYFILALAVVAIVHEFSHGVFMRTFKIKIKSTGMVFLGPIMGAFVEQDDKSMNRKKTSEQMAVLGAGVFANIITALIFYGLYILFFFTAFSPAGYQFSSYGMAVVPTNNITGISNSSLGLINISTTSGNFYLDNNLAVQLQQSNQGFIHAYEESGAVLAQMKGAIIEADGVKIIGQDSLRKFLQDKNPGDVVTLTTEDTSTKQTREYTVKLGSRPDNDSKAYLGVGYAPVQTRGIVGKVIQKFMSFQDPSIYYKPKFDGNFVEFIYNLLWWIMIINLLVALFNMLPLGILDGGRFFYLGVFKITKSEKATNIIEKIMKALILSGVVLMMVFWLFGILR